MIRMSLTGSTMGEPYSWGRGQAGCVMPLSTPPRLRHLRRLILGDLSQDDTDPGTFPATGLPRTAAEGLGTWPSRQRAAAKGSSGDGLSLLGLSRSPTAITLWPWSLMGHLGRGRPSPHGLKETERRWAPSAWGQSRPHLEQVPHGLSEAHRVHGHTHSVGESENEADGAPELWAQAPGDEEVGATCGGQRQEHEPSGVSWMGWQKRWLGEGTTGSRGPRGRK